MKYEGTDHKPLSRGLYNDVSGTAKFKNVGQSNGAFILEYDVRASSAFATTNLGIGAPST